MFLSMYNMFFTNRGSISILVAISLDEIIANINPFSPYFSKKDMRHFNCSITISIHVSLIVNFY
jgi:hypothetical protein